MFWGSLCMYSGICMLARVRVFTYVVHVCLLKYVNFPTFQCDSVCIHWLRQLFLRMFMVDVLMAQLWYMRVCIYKEVWRVCADWHTYVNVRHSIIQHLCGFTITIYCLRLAVFVQGRPVDAVQSALCGSFAGALAGGVTTPLDVIKTRLMLGTCKEIYTCSNTSNWEENNIRIRACIHPCLDTRVYSAWHTDPTEETCINTLKRGQRNIKRKHNAHPYLYDLHYTHTYRMHVEWFTVNLLRLHMCKSTPAAIHEHISSAAQTKHHTHISPFIQVCRHKCAWPHMQNSNTTNICACVSTQARTRWVCLTPTCALPFTESRQKVAGVYCLQVCLHVCVFQGCWCISAISCVTMRGVFSVLCFCMSAGADVRYPRVLLVHIDRYGYCGNHVCNALFFVWLCSCGVRMLHTNKLTKTLI